MESSAESKVVHGSVSTDYDVDDQAQPMPFTQGELNDMTRDFNLSKKFAQLLDSRLREKCLSALTSTFNWYRQREAEVTNFFTHDEASSLVYCRNIVDFAETLGVMYIFL